MDWKEVGSAILDFAPTIGEVLLGPPGAAMGVGIKALAGALGMSEDEITPEAALSRIQADPQVAADLKKADIAARVEIRKAELADVADARLYFYFMLFQRDKIQFSTYCLEPCLVSLLEF